MQNKGKWLKNIGGGTLNMTLILGPSRGVSYLDTGTLQDMGHLLGGFTNAGPQGSVLGP